MNDIENSFFEKYKKLEKFCNEIFNSKEGVKLYIEYLEENVEAGERIVPSWKDDYYLFKHLRYVRNQIAHFNDDGYVCTSDDIKKVDDFYDRFLNQKDPIFILLDYQRKEQEKALARKKAEESKKKGQAQNTVGNGYQYSPEKYTSQNKNNAYKYDIGIVVVVTVAILALLAIVYFATK